MDSQDSFLKVTCPGCQKRLKIRDDRRGMRLKCPGCGQSVTVPHGSSNLPVTSRPTTDNSDFDTLPPVSTFVPHVNLTPTPEEQLKALLQRFDGDFPRPRFRVHHVLTATLVAVVMMILPIIYLAFIAAIAWLTYWHAEHDWVWMTATRGRASAVAAMAYLGLVVAGGVWVLSMLKPFFRNWGKPEASEGIRRDQEKLLFLFSDRLADIVGCPRPSVIQLSPEVNAAASYQTSMFGLFRENFCLTLGMPLVAGLTLPQLAGVIAHEYGHFAQSRSTFLSRMIYQVNSWFAQAIYQRDWIDEFIDEVTHGSDHMLISIFGFIVWGAVNLGRGLLWCLMWFGAAVSGTLSRQMEYDADQYACGVVGSETHAITCERIVELSIAAEVASHYILTSNDGHHLPVDYPAFVAGLSERYGKVRKKAKKTIREERSSWLTTHPPMRDRIAAAQRLNLPGIFDSKLSGKKLFHNFQNDCKNLTLMLYHLRFGNAVRSDTLRPTNEALESYISVLGGK